MKNKNLLKVLGITLAAVLLLTWVIPSSTFDSYSTAAKLSTLKPTGIWDLFGDLGIACQYFWQGALFFLFVGGFYGLLGKTGLLKGVITKIASVFKGNEKWFLILSTALFMITASLVGVSLPLFIFVPLFVAVILSMGYKKVVALTATVGAIIIGSISVIYSAVLNQPLTLTGVQDIWLKLILLVLTLGVTIFYLLAFGGKEESKEELEKGLLLNEKGVEIKRKPLWPIITAFITTFVITVIGMLPWEGMLKVKLFTNIHNAVIGVKIGNFHVFQNLLGGTLLPLGQWTTTELCGLLAVVSFILVFVYGIKWRDAIDGFAEGFKKMLPTALLVLAVNLVVIFTLNSGFYTTAMSFAVKLTSHINVFIMSITTFLGSILSIDSLYVANYNISVIHGLLGANGNATLLLIIAQTMYGVAMLIAPTSILLLVGLSYLEIPYTKWLKYVWRLFLMLLIAIFIILIAATLL